MLVLARVAAELGLRGTVASDRDGYPGILGYRGPTLSEVTGASVPLLDAEIERMLVRKSPAEIELLRESGRWCAHAHRLLEQYTRVGATEAEASLRAQQETTLAMLAAHGSRGLLGSGDGAKAGYRGQIGRRSSWAHAVAHNIEFQPGDVLVTETGAPVWGYQAELERALFVGPPTDRMRWLFDHMLGSREAAFAAIRPGATCADVDGAVMGYFAEHDLQRYWRQHTGHGAGLRNHEAPFLDVGDPTPLEPGMVFTIEPGLYDPEVGGFRHSDTVVVTEEGYRPPHRVPERPREPDASRLRAAGVRHRCHTPAVRGGLADDQLQVVVVGVLADHRDRVGAVAERDRLADADMLDRAVADDLQRGLVDVEEPRGAGDRELGLELSGDREPVAARVLHDHGDLCAGSRVAALASA